MELVVGPVLHRPGIAVQKKNGFFAHSLFGAVGMAGEEMGGMVGIPDGTFELTSVSKLKGKVAF